MCACACVRAREGGREGGRAENVSAIRYEEQLKETKLQKEDLSDMVAEHAAKQKV